MEAEEEFPRHIYSDYNRLRQIIINLLSNAIKYTPRGSIFLKATVNDDCTYKIDVIDTGVGISKRKISSLFTPFTKIMDNRQINKHG